MGATPLHVELEKDGALLRLRLSRPKANIVDAAMIAALRSALDGHLSGTRLRAVLLEAEGPHFSFGASVEEHLPGSCAAMLRELHALILQLVASPVPVLVAVRGQCLGGGLEVAAAGHLIFAAPGATLGQPEIKLAVFAPAASCLLPERIGLSRAGISSSRGAASGRRKRTGSVSWTRWPTTHRRPPSRISRSTSRREAPVPSGSPCAPPGTTSFTGSAGSSPKSSGCTSRS